jgi:flagellar motor component MotA
MKYYTTEKPKEAFMRKKALIIPMAIVVLLVFGIGTSANAFVDPISLSVIIGASFLTLVTANEMAKHTNTGPVKAQAKANELKQNVADTSKISKAVTPMTHDTHN